MPAILGLNSILVLIKTMYQNLSYSPAQPQYSMNVYTDIVHFFCEVNQALNFTGTYCFEERKREYWRQSNDIIALATNLSQFQMIPMKVSRSSGLGTPLSELESDIIRNIILQTQISENNVLSLLFLYNM